MEKSILVIVLIVALVGVVGFFSNYDFSTGTDALGGGITGNVVYENADCNGCAGYAPICAKQNNRYITFNNVCEAVCDGADVVRFYPCEQIPQN